MMEKTQTIEIKKPVSECLRASLVNRLKEIAKAENIRHYQTLIDDVLTDYVQRYKPRKGRGGRF